MTTELPEPHRDWRGHDFWPAPEVLAAIPPLYGTEEIPAADKIVHLHYFIGSCDWWVVEVDPAERLAFGYVVLGDPQMSEWGYIPLEELANMFRPPQPIIEPDTPGWTLLVPPLVVERDLDWTPRPAAEATPYLS